MAFPFYQGNIQDLMRQAGQMQGTAFLSQMAQQEKDKNAADLETSYLNQQAKRQEMAQNQEMQPWRIKEIEAKIKEAISRSEYGNQQTRQLKGQNDIVEQIPIDERAKGVKADITSKVLGNEEKQTELLRKEFFNLKYNDPNFDAQVFEILKRYGLNPDSQRGQAILQAATSPETWKEYLDWLYNSSEASRQLSQRGGIQLQNTQAMNEGRLAAAEIRARDAANRQQQIRGLQQLAAQYNQRAFQLIQEAKGKPPAERAAMEQLAKELRVEAAAIGEQLREITQREEAAVYNFEGAPPRTRTPRTPVVPIGSPGATPPAADFTTSNWEQ